jgi:hypothetical protein
VNRHLSSEEITAWLMGDATADALRHTRACPSCSVEVERLREALAGFRESGQRWSANVMVTPQRPRRVRIALSLAAACLPVLAAAMIFWTSAPKPADRPFIAVPYVAPLAPYERTSVMRMEVPVAALVAAGFQVHGVEPGSTVKVDVLVGQDGRMHAVRLISNGSVIQ